MAKRAVRIAQRYPYRIHQAELPEHTELMSSSWNWLEFMRIEALLRSPVIHEMYLSRRNDGELYKKYGFTWSILNGSHHELLTRPDRRITDVDDIVLDPDDKELWNRTGVSKLNVAALMREPSANYGSDFACLVVDLTRDPKTLKRGVETWLRQQNRKCKRYGLVSVSWSRTIEGERIDTEFRQPFDIDRPSPIRRLSVWLESLRCYDMRHCEKKTFGEIAHEIYERKLDRDKAEKGFNRIRELIAAAEQNKWPP
jgi:hypothetical protein